MTMYIVSAIIFVFIFLNYFLGYRLYKEPSNEAYYSNVKHFNVIHQRDIMPRPGYIFANSVLLGIFLGIYISLGRVSNTNWYLIFAMSLVLLLLYLIDITRKIKLTDECLELEKIFSKTKRIPLEKIDGIYVYSYNKKFLNKNAFTTKLVIVSGKMKYKFTLSGIDVRAVLNMMKENFGVSENKMYIAQK